MAKAASVGGVWIPETCSKADLSKLLGISIRSIRDLEVTGILVPATGRGRYETLASIQNYLGRLREQAAGRATKGGNNLADERAEETRIDKEIKAIKLAQLKGEILTLDEVSASWSAFAGVIKGSLLALPSKARTSIPHLTAHDGEVLREMVRDMLLDLSDEVEASVIAGDKRSFKSGK